MHTNRGTQSRYLLKARSLQEQPVDEGGADAPRRSIILLIAATIIVASQPIFLGTTPTYVGSLVALAVVSVFLLGNQHRKLFLPAVLLIFLAWAGLSVGWSRYPEASMVVVMQLALVALIAMTCATAGSRSVARGIQLGGVTALLASVALAVISPSQGLVSDFYQSGALQGIYSHRNTLGAVLAVGVVAVAARLGARDGSRARLLIWLLLLMAGVAATLSSTALIVAVGVVITVILFRIFRAFTPVGRALAVVFSAPLVMVAALWLPQQYEAMTRALDRDITLTGRTYIWDVVWRWIGESPIIGQGWGGVWQDGQAVGEHIRSAFGYDAASSAHNGFLDVILHLGVVGFALYIAVFVVAIVRSVRLSVASKAHLWMPVTLGLLLVYNMLESWSIRPTGMFLLSLVYCTQVAMLREGKPNTPVRRRRYSVR